METEKFNASRILLVEDEPKVAAFVSKGLEKQHYRVDMARDGVQGRDMAKEKKYDLIIIDINLPLLNGIELCQTIRARDTRVPILMLTALGTTRDKVNGFDAGADDYLVKPFEFPELLVRIRALLKRVSENVVEDSVLRVSDLELNLRERVARRGGTLIELTAREFALLEYLMRHSGRVISRLEIAEHVWDVNFDTGTNIIDVYVNYLRKKIDKDFTPKLIHTLIGMGYTLKEK